MCTYIHVYMHAPLHAAVVISIIITTECLLIISAHVGNKIKCLLQNGIIII